MKTRVKVEWKGQDKANYAYATTEHYDSSYGLPVILIGGKSYSASDLILNDGCVVTADRGLADKLDNQGYPVRISNPQAKWNRKNMKNVTVNFTAAEYKALQDICEEEGISIHKLMKDAAKKMIKK